MKEKIEKENKHKNTMLKNIGIVITAWIKKYPTALLFIPVYLACRIVSPFLGSLVSSKAIEAITLGNPEKFLITVLGLLGVAFVSSAISNILGSILMGQRIYTRLGVFAQNLFRKALTTDFQNVELQKKQKILGKAANALSSNYNGPEEVMNQTLNIVVILLGIGSYGTVIFIIDWKILLAVLAMFMGNVILQTVAIKYNDKHREEGSEIWRKKNYIKQKSMNVSAGKDIRIYQLKNWFHLLLNDVIRRRRDYTKRLELFWYLPTISDVGFNFFREFLAYSILIKRVISGQIDAATFTLYIGLIGSFSNWIYGLSGNFNSLRRASHEFNDYFDFMDLQDSKEKTIQNKNNTEEFSSAPEITFKNVEFTYDGAEKPTLQDLNFTIHAGEKIALVGNNGAGKTTIVKLLTGLYSHTGGDILVNGESIQNISIDKYQDNISVLFQDTVPMAFSLESNVASVEDEKIDTAKVIESLQKAGLLEKVESLPKREKTFITQNLDDDGILLSGGETQKLLLAKAIYKNGNFLILDEPTSALDPIAESKIYEEYNAMAKGKTAVFISHRLASTKFCDKIMFLDGGKIAEFGTHEELMKRGGKYKEMFEIQSQYYVK